jgi:hypothetical protein
MTSAAEILRQRLAVRSSMVEWARLCGYQPAPHHSFIIQRLEKVAAGELRRLLIAAPPGSAKSTYASVLFPAWYLCRHPDHQIICASHTAELSEKHARRARNLIMEHGTTLGVELADDSQSAGRWSLKSGGSVFAVGAGGAVVGQRADAVLIDDPLRGREEAHSDTAREKLYEWYISDLLTRLRPGGKICLISTRWHEDDLLVASRNRAATRSSISQLLPKTATTRWAASRVTTSGIQTPTIPTVSSCAPSARRSCRPIGVRFFRDARPLKRAIFSAPSSSGR